MSVTGCVAKRRGGFVYVVVRGDQKQRCTNTGCRGQAWVEGKILTRCDLCGAAMAAPRPERRQKMSRQFATKQEAKLALREALATTDRGRDPFRTAPTGFEYAPVWIEHKRSAGVRPSSLARYEVLLNRRYLPVLGALRIDQVKPSHIQRVLDEAAAAGLAPRTVQQLSSVTSSMFETAFKLELVDRNPVRGATARQADRPDLAVPTGVEVNRLIESARGVVWFVPVLLAASLGTRRSETLGLAWSNVDLDTGRVSITRTLQRVRGQGLVFLPPKSERSYRVISLPGFAIPELRQHRKAQAERRLLAGEAWQDLDLLCDRGDGGPLDPDAFSHASKRLMLKAGIDPRTRLHDLRHSLGTSLLEQGIETAVVSAVLGHASTWFTADTYLHIRPEMTDQAAKAVERAFGR